jgi:hypothetical protein
MTVTDAVAPFSLPVYVSAVNRMVPAGFCVVATEEEEELELEEEREDDDEEETLPVRSVFNRWSMTAS